MANVFSVPFQKWLEILSLSQAKINLLIFYEIQVSNSNSNLKN